MPTPKPDEKEGEYISRCMGDDDMSSEFPEQGQRAAVCYTYWRNYSEHGTIKPPKSDNSREDFADIDLKPTEPMAAEAARGLAWRDEFNRGGTAVGVARARDIKNRKELSSQTIGRMVSYFARHEVDKKGKGWSPGSEGYPSSGRIAWALWGGEPGKTWANARFERLKKMGRATDDDLVDDETALEDTANFAAEKPGLVPVKDVEIFAEGTWNGLPFTAADLDDIVSSFETLKLGGRVPLKLGHNGPDVRDDPTTQFAMGWVKRVWRAGKKLMADLEVPQPVSRLLDQGFLRFVSVELLQNVRASSRSIPWVLDAIALLGTDQPAVGILKDIKALSTYSRDFQFGARHAFSRESFQPLSQGAPRHMSDPNTNALLESIQSKLLAQNEAILALQNENRTLKLKDSEAAQLRARFDRLVEENKARDIETHRSGIRASLESAVKNEQILPAARERFCKVYRVDDDEAVMHITAEDVAEFVRENPNPVPRRKTRQVAFSLDASNGDVPPGTPADHELALRVFARLREQGVHRPTHDDLVRTGQEIMRMNRDLAEQYRYLPDVKARESRA